MTDKKNAMIQIIESKLAIAESMGHHEIWVSLDVMHEILDLLKEKDKDGTDMSVETWFCADELRKYAAIQKEFINAYDELMHTLSIITAKMRARR